jgi:hypothetical protein
MATNDNTGDFKDKQFQKEEVADKVVEQYDEERARIFYKHVMVSVRRLFSRKDPNNEFCSSAFTHILTFTYFNLGRRRI